jgi:hypothetical protein
MTPEQEAVRGRAIASFLENEHVAALLDGIEARYLDAFRASRPDEPATREHAYRMLRAVADLRDEMRAAVGAGRFAESRLSAART